MKKKDRPSLSELENKVMAIVWQQDEVTASQVRADIKLEQPPKESTIRTILSRLETKGYVEHRTQGRAYLYSATERSQNVAADAVRGIVDRICQGSVESLLVGMVNQDVVSSEQLREMADRIAAEQNAKSKKNSSASSSKRAVKNKTSRRKGS